MHCKQSALHHVLDPFNGLAGVRVVKCAIDLGCDWCHHDVFPWLL
ncbi:hypothetical protein SUDANB5_05994 [Streptomyces sp. SudanB5_2050]